MDLNQDGFNDIITGPGSIHYYERRKDGSFKEEAILKNGQGKNIGLGTVSTAFATDWDLDGNIDLLYGNTVGQILVSLNNGAKDALTFDSEFIRIELAGEPIRLSGPTGVTHADWDGDGKHDLILATQSGQVAWLKNEGQDNEPEFNEMLKLIDNGVGTTSFDKEPASHGLQSKISLGDFNNDGKIDILLGDTQYQSGKPMNLTSEQTKRLAKLRIEIRNLEQKRKENFDEFQIAIKDHDPGSANYQKATKIFTEKSKTLGGDRALRDLYEQREEFQNKATLHGHVWVFLRK